MIVTMATMPACSRAKTVTALYNMVYHIPYMYVHHKLAYKHPLHKGVLDSLPVLVVVQGVPQLRPRILICFSAL